jgi:hypothetical protein
VAGQNCKLKQHCIEIATKLTMLSVVMPNVAILHVIMSFRFSECGYKNGTMFRILSGLSRNLISHFLLSNESYDMLSTPK